MPLAAYAYRRYGSEYRIPTSITIYGYTSSMSSSNLYVVIRFCTVITAVYNTGYAITLFIHLCVDAEEMLFSQETYL